MKHIQGENRHQAMLFPESLDELIGEDHLVRVIDLYVSQLDLAQLGFNKVQTATKGRPPYAPGDLLKLYLYGYLNRVRSSRRLEAECQRNIEVMWLLGRLVPDHKTIANFRKDQAQGIQGVCKDFVQFCRRVGLIGADLVAIDGSKFQAVASRNSAITEADLARREAALQERIAHYLSQLDQADHQDGEPIDTAAVGKALEQLRQQQTRIEAQRNVFKGTRRTHQIEGESQARMVKDGQGRSFAGYNVQSAVDSRHKLIVHHDVVSQGNDQHQLLPMARAVQQVLGKEQIKIVADAGYSNGLHLSECEQAGIIPYVVPQRAGHPSGKAFFDRTLFKYDPVTDSFDCPAGAKLIRKQVSQIDRVTIYVGQTCGECALKSKCTKAAQRMVSRHFDHDSFERASARLTLEPQIMRQRKAIVEHPFGNLKRWIFGDARYLVRGLTKVQTETALAVLAYNLRRVINLLGVQTMKQYLAA